MATSKLDKAKMAAKRARERAKEAKGKNLRRMSLAASSAALAAWEDRIPTVMSLDPALTVAGVGLVAEAFLGGTAGDVAEGVSDSALAVATYKTVKRGSLRVAGGDGWMDPDESVDGLPALGAGADDYEEALLESATDQALETAGYGG